MKIYLSLLLPTKDSKLNGHVNELNMCYRQLAANHGNVDIVEHFNLVDERGFLNPTLGRYKRGLPNSNDFIHLGNNGIKRFVLNIKSKVLNRKSLNGKTQPSHSRTSQLPPPTSTVPWQRWSSGYPLTTSSSHSPVQYPTSFSNPSPTLLPAPVSSAGNHQHVNATYQAMFPSMTTDGCQY